MSEILIPLIPYIEAYIILCIVVFVLIIIFVGSAIYRQNMSYKEFKERKKKRNGC